MAQSQANPRSDQDAHFSGFLLIDKPHGPTSFDVVAGVRRIFRTKKVGHSGTLDPFATGLLVLALGEATKLLEFLPTSPKVYSGEGVLGSVSDTLDLEGTLEKRFNDSEIAKRITLDMIKKCVQQNLLGKIMQIPPQHSAIKVDGVRAYKHARRGEKVELKARPAEVFAMEISAYDPPVFSYRCEVTGGTYVRSLVATLGDELGVGAYVKSLRRESIAHFDVKDAVTLEELQRAATSGSGDIVRFVLPLEAGVKTLSRVDISSLDYDRLSHGLFIDVPVDVLRPTADRVFAAFLEDICVGVLEVVNNNQLKFRKLLHTRFG